MVVSRFTRITAGQVYTSLTPTFGDVVARTLSKVALPYNVRYIVTMEKTEHTAERAADCRCQIVGWTRDPYEPHIPEQPEWEQADDCPVHPLHGAEKDAGLIDALTALLRQYTAGAYMTLNENREAMVREGRRPGASGGDVIRAGLGDWPESFLATRRDLVDDVRASVIPPGVGE